MSSADNTVMFCIFGLFIGYVIINVAIEIKYQIEVRSELKVKKSRHHDVDGF